MHTRAFIDEALSFRSLPTQEVQVDFYAPPPHRL